MIDTKDGAGSKPESFEPIIEFKDVEFSYPTRPDYKVRVKLGK